jgi:hypothetical protein
MEISTYDGHVGRIDLAFGLSIDILLPDCERGGGMAILLVADSHRDVEKNHGHL